MKQRGRKSTAKLAVLESPIEQRPAPPDSLSESQKAMWVEVVKSKPHDWFDAGSIPLLVEYCRVRESLDILAKEANAADPEWLKTDAGLKRHTDLWAAIDQKQGRMAQLAMKMRLTQQSRYDKRVAATAAAKAASNKRIWQRD